MIHPIDFRAGIRSGGIVPLIAVQARTPARVPLFSFKVSCGFPSPADDYMDRPLDFNELLVTNPPATFALRVENESMIGAGLFPNDIAIIDRSIRPRSGNIILALVDGGYTIKRYRRRASGIVLQAENKAFPDIPITEGMEFEVFGVMKYSIRVHA